MERRFLIFAGALTVVAITMGAGLILLARDKVLSKQSFIFPFITSLYMDLSHNLV